MHHNQQATTATATTSTACVCLYHPRRWTLLTFKMCLPSPRIFDTCLRYKVLSSLDMCASSVQILKHPWVVKHTAELRLRIWLGKDSWTDVSGNFDIAEHDRLHCVTVLQRWGPVLLFALRHTLTHSFLGGGFKHFLFLPLPGEMIQFD